MRLNARTGLIVALLLAIPHLAQACTCGRPKPTAPPTSSHTASPSSSPSSSSSSSSRPTPPSYTATAQGAASTRSASAAAATAQSYTREAATASTLHRPALKTDPVVTWQYSLEYAQLAAKTEDDVYAVYFCSADSAKLAGEGAAARAQFAKDNDSVPPLTIFDQTAVLNTLAEIELNKLVKIGKTIATEPLFKKLDVAVNTLVIYAPDGAVLGKFSGVDCNDETVLEFLHTGLFEKFGAWDRARTLNAEKAQDKEKSAPAASDDITIGVRK